VRTRIVSTPHPRRARDATRAHARRARRQTRSDELRTRYDEPSLGPERWRVFADDCVERWLGLALGWGVDLGVKQVRAVVCGDGAGVK
jgi:hypothetical protein